MAKPNLIKTFSFRGTNFNWLDGDLQIDRLESYAARLRSEKSREELQTALASYARQQAKTANQRLLRLERANLTSAPAYRGAQTAIFELTDATPKKPRYKENTAKLPIETLLKQIRATTKTLTAKTSTKRGVELYFKDSLTRLREAINAQGGVYTIDPNTGEVVMRDITYNELFDILHGKMASEGVKRYGYLAYVRMVMGANMTGQSIAEAKQAIDSYIADNLSVADVYENLGIKQQIAEAIKTAKGR